MQLHSEVLRVTWLLGGHVLPITSSVLWWWTAAVLPLSGPHTGSRLSCILRHWLQAWHVTHSGYCKRALANTTDLRLMHCICPFLLLTTLLRLCAKARARPLVAAGMRPTQKEGATSIPTWAGGAMRPRHNCPNWQATAGEWASPGKPRRTALLIRPNTFPHGLPSS